MLKNELIRVHKSPTDIFHRHSGIGIRSDMLYGRLQFAIGGWAANRC
jgi:hypothetical protein